MSPIGVAIILFVGATMWVGIRTWAKIKGQATNYYVAGNAMGVSVIGITLCAQAFDANGSMGNASLAHGGGFWAGAAIPIGLALCLFFTGAVFAEPIHRMRLLTLADFYRRRYSQNTETLAALNMLVGNIVLVAGNLAGLGLLLDLVFGVGYLPMLVVIALCILTYAVTGGLYATITTSVLQVGMFILSTLIGFAWLTGTFGWSTLMANVPASFTDLSGLMNREQGSLVTWASLVSLALGDVVAIDFIQRVIAADSARTAKRGCYIAGVITLVIGLMVTFIGLAAFHFGTPQSRFLLVEVALNEMPMIIGGLILLGVIAASMSTAAGVVLDLANVLTRNVIQGHSSRTWDDAELLRVSRWIALPTMAASVLFAYLRPDPGVLLILAFDIVLASCFVPLVLGLFWRKSNTPAALAAIVGGATARLILHFAIPEAWAGMETLIPPLVSLALFVIVAQATQGTSAPKHDALTHVPTEEELVRGV
jgi:Na+/proline symporter